MAAAPVVAAPYVDPCNGHFEHALVAGQCPIEIAANNRTVNNGRRNAQIGGVVPNELRDTMAAGDLNFINVVDHQNNQAYDFAG